ncbi:MAG TPA: cupin domain-containing protein, partial [Bacteroidetes bacterium]|nr:cupin domain-containing protein [Bacteroidota bacterium]
TIIEKNDFRIERIVSNGFSSSEGYWYNQNFDEIVFLLQGNAVIEFENAKTIEMKNGDYLAIPKHKKHRVKNLSKEPNCIWLAIHGELL